jgi:hypothetical protein
VCGRPPWRSTFKPQRYAFRSEGRSKPVLSCLPAQSRHLFGPKLVSREVVRAGIEPPISSVVSFRRSTIVYSSTRELRLRATETSAATSGEPNPIPSLFSLFAGERSQARAGDLAWSRGARVKVARRDELAAAHIGFSSARSSAQIGASRWRGCRARLTKARHRPGAMLRF